MIPHRSRTPIRAGLPRPRHSPVRGAGYFLLTLALAGCASYGGLSSDQIAQIIKDKNASSGCVNAAGTAGVIKVAWANADKDALNGSQSVGADCTLLTSSAVPPKATHCAPKSYERQPDGTCLLITRDEACRVRGSAVVDGSKCP